MAKRFQPPAHRFFFLTITGNWNLGGIMGDVSLPSTAQREARDRPGPSPLSGFPTSQPTTPFGFRDLIVG